MRSLLAQFPVKDEIVVVFVFINNNKFFSVLCLFFSFVIDLLHCGNNVAYHHGYDSGVSE